MFAGPATLAWLLQQRAPRHLTLELLKAVEGLLRATSAAPPLQREVRQNYSNIPVLLLSQLLKKINQHSPGHLRHKHMLRSTEPWINYCRPHVMRPPARKLPAW